MLKQAKLLVLILGLCAGGAFVFAPKSSAQFFLDPLDRALINELHRDGFTGRIEGTLEQRLGRPINRQRADRSVCAGESQSAH